MKEIVITSGTAHLDLARAVASHVKEAIFVSAGCDTFPDGETAVQFGQNIRGCDVFIVQPTCAPTNQNAMEMFVIADAARRASAAQITAVIPYYGYARQDRKDRPRVPITAKLMANLLVAAGIDRVVTVHLHAEQIQGFFDIPADNLYTFPVLVPAIKEAGYGELVVAAPDIGAIKNAHAWATYLKAPMAVVAKNRISAEEVEVTSVIGNVTGKTVLLVDDLTESFGTLDAAARELLKRGALRAVAVVSHAPLLPKGIDRLNNSPIERLYTTDTVPVPPNRKIVQCSMAGLLGGAIWRIHAGESVSSLFEVRS